MTPVQYEELKGQDTFDTDQFDTYLVHYESGRKELVFMEDNEQIYKSIYGILFTTNPISNAFDVTCRPSWLLSKLIFPHFLSPLPKSFKRTVT